MKRFIQSLVILCLSATANAAVTTHLKVDCRTGARSCAEGTETLYYDAGWYENATRVEVYDGSSKIAEGANGSVVWQPDTARDHEFKLLAYSSGGATVGQESVIRSFSHIEVVTRAAKEATCTETGCTKGSCCSRCNAVLATSSVLPALGHVEVVTTAPKEPTCTESGWTKGSHCSRCNAVLSSAQTISAGHVEVVTTAARAATCTEDGCTKGSYCSRCNAVLLTSQTIAALGHSGKVTKAAVEPTSSTAGSTAEIRCLRCNELLEAAVEIPALVYIRNVMARQLWPHKKVEVCYTIEEDVGEVADDETTLALSCNNGEVGTITPLMSNTSSYRWPQSGTTWQSSGQGVANLSTSYIICSVTGPATVSFRWKVSSEENWDKLHFYVDGNEVFDAISGEVAWQDKTYSLSSGSHTLRWSYTKDGSVNNGFDCGWVDAIAVTGGSKIMLARTVIGDISRKHGLHCVTWDMEKDAVSVNDKNLIFNATYGSTSGLSGETAANTSSSVKDGMPVDGAMTLGYSPIDVKTCELNIDGETVLSSANSGSLVWQPRRKGTHTLTHIAGTNVWTRTVNVTALAYEEPTPNPPMAEDSNVKLTTSVRALTSSAKASGTIGTAKVDSSYSGTWSATNSVDWITLTYATRNVGLPVIYTVAENLGVEERTGYIYVSGHIFTVTQPGVGGSLDSNAAAVDANGGEGIFTVTVGAQASWRARSNVDWISVETLCGTGETEVIYHVAPWNDVSTRSGTITAAGCTFTVNQTGRLMRLNVTEVTKDYLAHDIVLTVDALASTDWGIALDTPWVSIVDRGSGKGGGTVTLAINENPSYAVRTATALIGTETLTIAQAGRPTAALSFAISPEQTTASVKGANGMIAVEATPDLPWTATSQANWLTVMPSFAIGSGNGNVVYTATPNPTMAARSGSISVTPDAATGLAGKTHSVTQPAATSMISVDAHTFAVDGDSFAVDVTIDDVVGWEVCGAAGVRALPSWVSVQGDLSRVGPGVVTVAVEPNMSIEPREATILIAGHEFHIVQRGRTITLEYGETVFAPESYEEATIEVHPNGNVAWTATPSDATWISVWSEDGNVAYNPDGSVSGTGDATLKYMVAAYVGEGSVKTGWIQIGNEKVYVAQRAYDLSIDPTGVSVSGNAGAGSVAVPASVGDVWNAIATEPWIKLVGSYDEVTGSGTVKYTFTDNDTGETRTGKIMIAGEEYTITQAARQLVTITATVMGEGCVEVEKAGGGGQRCEYSFDRGTAVDLTAVASNGWRFVRWEKDGVAVGDGTQTLSVTADVNQEIVAVFERIPVYTVNGESVVEGTIKSFTSPEPVVLGGTTQLVCRGTSTFPDKGTSFSMAITGNVSFEWDLWETNYWVGVAQTEGGTVSGAAGVRALPGWVEAGSEVTLAATPAAGYSLMRWISGEATSSSLQNKEGVSSGRSDGDVASPTGNGVASPLVLRVFAPLTVSAIFAVFNDTLAAAADAPSLTFRTGGDAAWTPVIDQTAETGYTSVRSGAIGAESETWLETTVSGAGTLSFNWRVECEHDDSGQATWDRLAVFVNGVEKARLDGVTDWQTVELTLTDAKSVIRWSFYRDDHDEPDPHFINCGWIDGVEVTK